MYIFFLEDKKKQDWNKWVKRFTCIEIQKNNYWNVIIGCLR